jgi:hypothetical protein
MPASSRSVKVGLSARSCRTAPSRRQSVGIACACRCLTRIFFEPSYVHFANFDSEDSDDLAALLGKRYGL